MPLGAVQKVELVGGESWLSHNLGSFLVGLAAIIAATLAAYVSLRNHRQQLAYDRKIRDRDAIRESIDAAVRGISDLVLQGITLSSHVRTLEETREGTEEMGANDADAMARQKAQIDQATEPVKATVPLLSAAINTVHADTIHLAIRLGGKHPVPKSQAKTREALKRWILLLNQGLGRNRTEEELKAASEGQNAFATARRDFESACFAWLNEDP
jgi:predicted RNase H-like nuclease (RuvC/YqgF family)